jgi:hypothetical protein
MLKELNSLINVRNFLHMLINDMSFQPTQEKLTAINKKLVILDKQITTAAIGLDIESIIADAQNLGKPIYSSEEVKTVADLDKFAALGLGMKAKPKAKVKANEMAK